MNLKELERNWDQFGKTDPLSAILRPEEKDFSWKLEDFFQTGREEIKQILDYVGRLGLPLSKEKALDFGCGVGRLTQALAPHFHQVTGVDIAPSMIEWARKYNRFPEKCSYTLNETDDLRLFPDQSFSFIYTNITLQHMEPRFAKNYIKEFIRLLAPQGVLIFQEPSGRKPQKAGFARKLKSLIHSLLPKTGPECKKPNQPEMEMYGVQPEEVAGWVQEAGGRIVERVPNDNSGPNWFSFQYCVTKGESFSKPESVERKSIWRILENPVLYRFSQHLLAPGAETRVLQKVKKLLEILPAGSRDLDIGCGPVSLLRQAGIRPVGVDPNHAYNIRFKSRNAPAVTGSAAALPFSDGSFDRVWNFGLLHHLSDQEARRAIREMLRVVRTGGCLVIFDGVLPVVFWRNPWVWLLRKLDRGRHMRRQEELEALLSEPFKWSIQRFPYSLWGHEGILAVCRKG